MRIGGDALTRDVPGHVLQLWCSPRGVPDPYDFHNALLGLDSVHDSARSADDLPDIGIIEFGDNATRFREIGPALHYVEHTFDKTGRRIRTEFGEIGGEFSQIEAGGRRPDQLVSRSANSPLILS
jgi:hypothetical protein